ncbi:CLUMA_CG020612, isoform A [Clunio marinus]|uniref:CLUMA_CG020612, isoform A n=1 Tax=Clunio marinus TaxID=568069 RepID=A0A1J1J5G2_9DIPT|nr:CLUMA_CG020612, isoform A [Clunio marinus]
MAKWGTPRNRGKSWHTHLERMNGSVREKVLSQFHEQSEDEGRKKGKQKFRTLHDNKNNIKGRI